MPKPKTEKSPPMPALDERTLPEIIREVSACVSKLTGKGFNRRAVIVLLNDSCGVGKREIESVLDGLTELERRYCK